MIRRPFRPSFPYALHQTYLEALSRARHFTIQFGCAQRFGSDARKKSDVLQQAIDDMAEELTGDRQHFHLKSASYPSD
jgi:hypothetical protein